MIQTAAFILFILGFFGKFTAFFVTLPDPVIGGVYFVMFGLIVGVGISNLKHVNLSSSRNVFIFGFSLFSGIALKYWAEKPETTISTGSANGDQILGVLLRNGGRNHRREFFCSDINTNFLSLQIRTAPFIGGLFAIILDNTIPGTRKERGLDAWAQKGEAEDLQDIPGMETYDIPWLRKITNLSFMKYVPISPAFKVRFNF